MKRVRKLLVGLASAALAFWIALSFSSAFASLRLVSDSFSISVQVGVLSHEFTYDGKPHAFTPEDAYIISTKNVNSNDVKVVWSSLNASLIDVGSVSTTKEMEKDIKIYIDGIDWTSSCLIEVSHGTLTILPAPLTIRAEEKQEAYTGSAQSVSLKYTVGALVEGEKANISFLITATDAGYYSADAYLAYSVYNEARGMFTTNNYACDVSGGFEILPLIRYSYKGTVPAGAPRAPSQKTAAVGKTYSLPDSPTVAGYTFSGWNSEDVSVSSAGKFTVPAAINVIRFTGSFAVETHTLEYYLEGAFFQTQELTPGAEIDAPEAPQKEGYSFGGWEKLPDTMPDEDLKIYGSYVALGEGKWVLKYVVGESGKVYATQYYATGEIIIEPDASDIDGFTGWVDLPKEMPDHDLTVLASISGPARAKAGKWSVFSALLAVCSLILAAAYNFGPSGRRSLSDGLLVRIAVTGAALLSATLVAIDILRSGGPAVFDATTVFVALALGAQSFLVLRRARSMNTEAASEEEEIDRLATGEYEVIRPGEFREKNQGPTA